MGERENVRGRVERVKINDKKKIVKTEKKQKNKAINRCYV